MYLANFSRYRVVQAVACVALTAFAVMAMGASCHGLPPPDFEVPDNGQGTANLPPNFAGLIAGINEPIITDGLPPGSAIELADVNIFGVNSGPIVPGGSLGGDRQVSTAQVQVHLRGTGALAGFDRLKTLMLNLQIDSGPRPFFSPIQSFPISVWRVQGQLPPGDPDFDILRISGGSQFGLPSPGHATLIQQGAHWACQISSDVMFRIDFIGHSPGMLAGMSSSTIHTKHIELGGPPSAPLHIPPGPSHWRTLSSSITLGGTSPLPGISEGFFYPGSLPFEGTIYLRGNPPALHLGNTDTIVQRMLPADLPSIGSSTIVPVEMVQLRLVSVDPINVGGTEYNVHVELTPAGPGSMTITRTHDNGGTYSVEMPFRPVITFEAWAETPQPLISLPMDATLTTQTESLGQWSRFPPPGSPAFQAHFYTEPTTLAHPSQAVIFTFIEPDTNPTPAIDSVVGDLNGDGILDGRDIEGIAHVLTNGPVDPQFNKVDANANGAFDHDDMQRLINVVMGGIAPPGTWINVANTQCDNSRRIIAKCPGKNQKVIVRAADIAESASECNVRYQYRDCNGVDIGEPFEMDPGSTRCVSVGARDQLVVWCTPSPTSTVCRISYNYMECGPNP